MNKLLADIDLAPPGGFKGLGPLGLEGRSAFEGDILFGKVISTTVGVMSIVAIIWFIFLLITGAIGIMTAGDDKQAMTGAKKRISSGLIGLVIVIASLFVIKLLGMIFGIQDILNPASLIDQITR